MKNSLSFEIEADELEIFIQDVNEHLRTLETGILSLEKRTDPPTLDAVFRAAHTLKAVAAAVGHQQMAELTHRLETLFDAMRQGQLLANPRVTDELLATVDHLKALRDEVVTLEPSEIDVAAMLSRLQALLESEVQAPAPTEAPDPLQKETQPELRPQLTSEQSVQARSHQRAGSAIWEVRVRVDQGAFAPSARLLQAAIALAELGQTIAQHPSQIDLASGEHAGHVWLVLASQVEPDEIEKTLKNVSDLDEFQVKPYVAEPPASNLKAPTVSDYGEDKTVRVNVERLDTLMNLVGELVTERTRLAQIEETLRTQYGKGGVIDRLDEMTTHFHRVVDQLQNEVMQARMVPIAQLFQKFPRLVRDTARIANKEVDLVIQGEATELDRSVIEAISDPLTHLLRNAVGHGIETPPERVAAGKTSTGTVWLTAAHKEGQIVITVQDDGQGIDPQRIRRAAMVRGSLSEEEAAQLDDDQAISLIFQPGLSTAERITGVSGRGVGLDVVHTNVKQLGGSTIVESQIGRGTTFHLILPLTLAIVQTMLVALGEDVYAIPLTGIVESLYLSDVPVSSVKGNPVAHWRDQALPLLRLRQFFAHSRLTATPPSENKQAIVTVTWGKLQVGLIVDRLIGKQEVVVKSLSSVVGNVPGLSGCTVLGDGRIALIVDVPSLVNTTIQSQRRGRAL